MKPYNMSGMFYCCSALESIDSLKYWDVDSAVTLSFMFYGCSSLHDASCLDRWNLESAKTAYAIFSNCTSLEKYPKWHKGELVEKFILL
jgi:surface protein